MQSEADGIYELVESIEARLPAVTRGWFGEWNDERMECWSDGGTFPPNGSKNWVPRRNVVTRQ